MVVKASPRWYASLGVVWLVLAVGQLVLAVGQHSTVDWTLAAGLAVLALVSLSRWAALRRGIRSTS